jgi:hypothetical protein
VLSLLDRIDFRSKVIDPCAGDGAVMNTLSDKGHITFGCDIEPLVGAPKGVLTMDFLLDPWPWGGMSFDIITNPPYGTQGRLAVKFIERAIEVTRKKKGKVAMLLPADFDSASSRVHIFRDCREFAYRIPLLYRIKWFTEPPACYKCKATGMIVGVTCPRCKGAGFKDSSPAENHAWYVWDHNREDYYAGHASCDYAGRVVDER